MNILIVSSSLNPESRSRELAKMLEAKYRGEELEVTLIDLQAIQLPFCDGGAAYGDPVVQATKQLVEAADAVAFAGPIYVYGTNAAQKNFVELFGRTMEGKLAGFLCAAGGAMSYMAIMPFANALMLDFRMMILPRFVYVTGSDWDGDALKPEVAKRFVQFSDDFVATAKKLLA
tara:strand:- start:114 stop:635 length:522 start_codon:yes stop_codon:yes gene_type:complete